MNASGIQQTSSWFTAQLAASRTADAALAHPFMEHRWGQRKTLRCARVALDGRRPVRNRPSARCEPQRCIPRNGAALAAVSRRSP
jgi:hypothetical protein